MRLVCTKCRKTLDFPDIIENSFKTLHMVDYDLVNSVSSKTAADVSKCSPEQLQIAPSANEVSPATSARTRPVPSPVVV